MSLSDGIDDGGDNWPRGARDETLGDKRCGDNPDGHTIRSPSRGVGAEVGSGSCQCARLSRLFTPPGEGV
jgi:hypothetical protein